MTQFILALCGLPASGKSILAEALKKGLNSDVEIVATDKWRDDMYYTDWKPEKEGPVREAALKRIVELVTQGKSAIHDDTNYYNSMRHDLFKIALENQCAFAVIHVSTSMDTALKWNSERPDSKVPNAVIERINERFDLPGRRYLWDDPLMEVDMATNNIEDIVTEITKGILELEIAVEPQTQTVTNTRFERLDIETRHVVTEFLEEHPSLRRNRKVSEIRRSVLSHAVKKRTPVKEARDLLLERLSELV